MTYNPEQEAEQSFLGSMIREPSLIPKWITRIEVRDFGHLSHELTWKAIRFLFLNGKPVSVASIADVLRRNGKEAAFGDLGYIEQLRDSVVSVHQADHYGELIKKNSAYRKVQGLSHEIDSLVYGREHETEDDLIYAVEMKLLALKTAGQDEVFLLDNDGERFRLHAVERRKGIKTGFAAFDAWSDGIPRGTLYVLAGRPSVGKTAKAVQQAIGMSDQDAGEILFWSMEMSDMMLMDRAVSCRTGIAYKKFVTKTLSEDEIEKAVACYQDIARNPIHIGDAPSVSLAKIKTVGARIKRERGRIAAIFVDYLTQMDIPVEKGSTYAKAVEQTCKQFKTLARDLDCVVVLLAQFSRGLEDENRRPTMADLKDSGGIEQAADIIEALWMDKADAEAHRGADYALITSSILKGRLLGVRDFKYKFLKSVQRFEDYEAPYLPADEIVQDGDGYFHAKSSPGKRTKGYSRR